jgi:hypothetical protein
MRSKAYNKHHGEDEYQGWGYSGEKISRFIDQGSYSNFKTLRRPISN